MTLFQPALFHLQVPIKQLVQDSELSKFYQSGIYMPYHQYYPMLSKQFRPIGYLSSAEAIDLVQTCFINPQADQCKSFFMARSYPDAKERQAKLNTCLKKKVCTYITMDNQFQKTIHVIGLK